MNQTSSPVQYSFRAAVPEDVDSIHEILGRYAEEQLLLPRTREDLLERIKNFRIVESEGKFAGCAAMRDYGNQLFEIRSLAVHKDFSGKGIGSALIRFLLRETIKKNPDAKIFALTYRVHFFTSLNFHIVDKQCFPQKIWSDCSICSKFNCCDETAVLYEAPVGSC